MKKDRPGPYSRIWPLLFSIYIALTLNTAYALHEGGLTGPAFGDPEIKQTMPEQWVKRPVTHTPSAGQVDLVVSLNQQFFGFMAPLIKQYAKTNGLKIFINKGTCGISAKMLEKKEADIVGYCCPPAKWDRLPGVRFHTLGVHPLCILVNPENPIENLTADKARRIFQGKIVRWSELGWKNIPVQPVARLHCKKRFGHWRLLLDNEDLFSPALREVGSIPDMYGIIESTPGAVGFEMAWFGNTKERKLKVLRINGFAPDVPENIRSLRYPFYRTIYLTTWDTNTPENFQARKLIEYLKGQMPYVNRHVGVIPTSQLQKSGWKFKGDELIGEPGK